MTYFSLDFCFDRHFYDTENYRGYYPIYSHKNLLLNTGKLLTWQYKYENRMRCTKFQFGCISSMKAGSVCGTRDVSIMVIAGHPMNK